MIKIVAKFAPYIVLALVLCYVVHVIRKDSSHDNQNPTEQMQAPKKEVRGFQS